MKRTLIVNGRPIVIEGLGQPMDEAFDKLHAAYFGGAPLAWNEFEAAASDYFSTNVGNFDAHDAYFNNFTVIWRSLLDTGQHDHAENLWERALEPAHTWEQANPGRRLHKGTPYYFWSMTALLRGHIDRGYLLMHQGVDEDIQSGGQPTPNTPGYALVSLNYQRVDQAFRQWVIQQADFVERRIENYNQTHRQTLTLADVKRRFLDTPPSTETLFLFTYTLARLMKLVALPTHTTNSAFAGQLELNLLFDVTLVIDAAIKHKNPNHWKFIRHAECLLAATATPLTNAELRMVNQEFEQHFDQTVQAALDGTLTITPNKVLDRLQCDVALAYGLRNFGAHNVGTAPTIWNRFDEVQMALFRVLFLTIEHLY